MIKEEYKIMLETSEEKLTSIVPCFNCGKNIQHEFYKPRKRVYCDECKDIVLKQYDEDVKTHVFYKLKVMHEHAIRIIENSCRFDINKLKESIEFVREMELHSPESFLSSYEIVVAIILIEENFLFKINHSVGKYKIDFFLPEEKICLEVDGGFHEYSLAKDGKRDIEIRHLLGSEWETIRISTKYIERNPSKIIEFMQMSYDKIKEARSKNNGMLPSNFSKVTKAYYREIGLESERNIFIRK